MAFDSTTAQMLLLKCKGDEIWDVQTCLDAGIPQPWIDEMLERYESGFDSDRNSIYVDGKLVNQYEGVSDLQIALKLAEYLGIDWQRVTASVISRRGQVEAIIAELDEI